MLSVKDQDPVVCQIRQVPVDSWRVQGDQEVRPVLDREHGTVLNPDLCIVVASPDPRLHVLMDQGVVAVSGEDLPHSVADRLHSLACLPCDSDTQIKRH